VHEIKIKDSLSAKRAVEEFLGGLHCSEAILKVFNECYTLGLPPDLYKIATALGQGLGGAKCCCGSLTGSALVLSLVAGRNTAEESDELACSVAKELHDEFKKRFKATCCRALTGKVEWGSEEHYSQCSDYVRGAAEITAALLEQRLNRQMAEEK